VDWEQWLRNAGSPPSDHEDDKRDRTERQIRAALESYEPLKGRPYVVYTKGSYANNTNVRLDFDVDIAVEYRGHFYYDLCFELEGQHPSAVGIIDSLDPYSRSDFKADIRKALEVAFGASSVSAGRIAYRVREKATTLPADVVPSWEYRRYDRADGTYHEGTCVFPRGGSRAENFPKLQLRNGNRKNGLTGNRYKRMVRALKKIQSKLLREGKIDESLPSYLIECLVYNVSDDEFGHEDYLADMRAVLATIFNATLNDGDWHDWEQVNRLQYLFRGAQDWDRFQVQRMAGAAWTELGFP
jgi:hypothetical protein